MTLKSKMAGRMLMTNEQKKQIIERERRSMSRGRIAPTDVDTKKNGAEDKPDAVPVAQADIISGVVAATVGTNRIMPVSNKQAQFDMMACFYAVIDGTFTGFRMPSRGHRLHEYATDLEDVEFDEAAFDMDPRKQNLLDLRNLRSYAIMGLIRCDQAGLNAFIACRQNDIALDEMRWAGPWHSTEQYLMSLRLDDHVISGPGGGRYGHTPVTDNVRVTVPPVDVVETGDHALIDLTCVSIDGDVWEIYPTRIR